MTGLSQNSKLQHPNYQALQNLTSVAELYFKPCTTIYVTLAFYNYAFATATPIFTKAFTPKHLACRRENNIWEFADPKIRQIIHCSYKGVKFLPD